MPSPWLHHCRLAALLAAGSLVAAQACGGTPFTACEGDECTDGEAGGSGGLASGGTSNAASGGSLGTGGAGGTAAGEGGSPSSVTGSTTGGAGGEAGGGQEVPPCQESADCTEATASVCDDGTCSPCGTNTDCAHLEGLGVCDLASGECVECTVGDARHCGVNSSGQALVCNSLTRSCSEQAAASSGPCDACVSDASCQAGMLCIQERYLPGGINLGYVCAREADVEGGTLCSAERPFAQVRNAVLSIDGKQADVCVLAMSTCRGRAHFRSRDCETETPDVLDHERCGEPDVEDGICTLRENTGSDNVYRCSVPCGSDVDCNDSFACDIEANPPRCRLQVSPPSND